METMKECEFSKQIDWKTITINDAKIIKEYYKEARLRGCENTFANNVLWAPYYQVEYGIIGNYLVFITRKEPISVSFPIGKDGLKEVIEFLMDYFNERKLAFRMHLVNTEQFEALDALFPGVFEINYDRDVADYIYEGEKLRTLSGKKLHSKRNHINRFMELNPDWAYEKITANNIEECLDMVNEWCFQNNCQEDASKLAEIEVTRNAILNMNKLELVGGLIRANGKVIALSLGEACCDEVFVVHIEKAFADIQGSYAIINQQFLLHEAPTHTYINREEDLGEEGLRAAKMSYRPVFLHEKGICTIKTNQDHA